jgi:molecular chaperone GrpE
MPFEDQDQNNHAEEPEVENAEAATPPTDGTDSAAIAQLTQQLADAQKQAAEYLDQARRSAAELSNARRRMQREQEEHTARANARLLEKLIPVIDDVDRAFAALPADQADSEWVNGFRLIQRKLQGLLESEGVSTIQAEGQKFDPAVHYAVSHEEAEGLHEGDVISEVARGYKLGDRVLRPAMVRVAKG